MSSREEILASIRRNTKVKWEKPVLDDVDCLKHPDKVEAFCTMCRAMGGQAIVLGEGERVDEVIARVFPGMSRIASNLPGVACATFNPDETDDPRELDGTDLAVVAGAIGVAENGAVWIPQTVRHKAVYFIPERLAILLDRNKLVDTMLDAYRLIQHADYPFGTFIAGPSKTADIEQALVLGAHGAQEVLVILT